MYTGASQNRNLDTIFGHSVHLNTKSCKMFWMGQSSWRSSEALVLLLLEHGWLLREFLRLVEQWVCCSLLLMRLEKMHWKFEGSCG